MRGTRDPRLVWEFYSMRRRVAAAAKPNPAHFALAKLEQKLQDRLFLCTQNVDDLHEQAGSIRVVHMHGELFKSRCERCTRPPFRDTTTYDPPLRYPGATAEVAFDRTSAGSAKCRSSWIASSTHWTMHGLHGCGHIGRGRASRELCRSRRWSCPDFYVGAEEPANERRSQNVIWGKRANCCLICSTYERIKGLRLGTDSGVYAHPEGEDRAIGRAVTSRRRKL